MHTTRHLYNDIIQHIPLILRSCMRPSALCCSSPLSPPLALPASDSALCLQPYMGIVEITRVKASPARFIWKRSTLRQSSEDFAPRSNTTVNVKPTYAIINYTVFNRIFTVIHLISPESHRIFAGISNWSTLRKGIMDNRNSAFPHLPPMPIRRAPGDPTRLALSRKGERPESGGTAPA